MVQGAPQTAGRFAEEIRMYKAPPPEVSSEQFYETDPAKPYRRGWSIQTVSPLPITWAEHVIAQGHWGAPLREYMRDYVHWATLGALCEYLPQADNRVTLADENDRHGLPVAHFSYSQCDNDRALTQAATESMETILKAAGATEVMTIDRYAHLVGGARMAARPEDGVVDSAHRVFGIANLYVVDGSVDAHPGRGQPGADHHGAGGPGRRPADRARPARAHRAAGRCRMTDPPRIERVDTAVYRFPTERRRPTAPSPGTPPPPSWCWCTPAARTGLGWTYSSPAAAGVVAPPPGTGAATATTPSTSPPAGRRCTGPAATSAPAAW